MWNKILNKINPENKPIDKMSKDEILELLIKLNKCLRGLDESENVIEENMSAGDLVSPTREVQTQILEYLTENINKVNDKKTRASMVYYTLLNLHMFSDGNGRTSRFMYDLISGELSEENVSYYFHKDLNYAKESKRDLENSKGIVDIYTVNFIPDKFIGQQFGFIPQDILSEYNWITVGHTYSSPSTDSILPKSVLEQLSKKELQDLDKILHDGYSMYLCPSGLAMLYVSNKKGQLRDWVSINSNNLSRGIGIPGRLNFSIYKNPEMVADWNIDDFREVIKMGNTVKYARLKCLIDIFVEPEKYINIDTGKPYIADIIGVSKEKDEEITI